jgi:hypothetical protein
MVNPLLNRSSIEPFDRKQRHIQIPEPVHDAAQSRLIHNWTG